MHILKTTVDRGPMPVVRFHSEAGEEIHVRLRERSAADDDQTLVGLAKVMMLHAAAFEPPSVDFAEPGTQQRVAGETPGNQPASDLPAREDPGPDRDATVQMPANRDERNLSDAPQREDGT